MEALNVPLADTPVVTFWEGEIVDAKNYTFFTAQRMILDTGPSSHHLHLF
jgi:hypothetical protein